MNNIAKWRGKYFEWALSPHRRVLSRVAKPADDRSTELLRLRAHQGARMEGGSECANERLYQVL